MGELLPELYLHGLAKGDFELALRGLLGEGAPLSASSIQRLKAKWENEYEALKKQDFHDQQVVYLWADGLYVKAGIGRDKAALLVIQMGQFNLQPPFFGLSARTEDFQNESGSIQNLSVPFFFKIALLYRCQRMVNHHQPGIDRSNQALEFFNFTTAKQRARFDF